MSTQTLRTRRTVLQTAAAATTLAAPFVRGAHAAGTLSVFKKDLTGLLVVDPYNDSHEGPRFNRNSAADAHFAITE